MKHPQGKTPGDESARTGFIGLSRGTQAVSMAALAVLLAGVLQVVAIQPAKAEDLSICVPAGQPGKSIEAVHHAPITFINDLTFAVDVWWLDYEGEGQFRFSLNPGEGSIENTWLTHPWVVTPSVSDPFNRCTGYVLADKRSGKTFLLSDECRDQAHVKVTTKFTPQTAQAPQGYCVVWSFMGPGNQSVTDSKGLGFFDSETVRPETVHWRKFSFAGKYPYRSTGDSVMSGTITVPLKLSASQAEVFKEVTITWASAGYPAGYQSDVSVRFSSDGSSWGAWGIMFPNTTFTHGTFRAQDLRGSGFYQFRARLENASTGNSGAWSAVANFRTGGGTGGG